MPADALATLAALLRADDSVISPCVRDPAAPGELGELAAAGPGAAADPAEYALVVEAVREGYLLHFGEARIVATADADLRLLAGDYMYALGLERLAALGDLAAVRQLADLIALAAQLHAGPAEAADPDAPATDAPAADASGGAPARPDPLAESLWIAVAAAIAAGAHEPLEPAKAALRSGAHDAGEQLDRTAAELAEAAGAGGRLASVRAGIDSRAVRPI